MTRGKGGPTITEVAEAAGVSRATVSRVLNGRASVNPSIGMRVREAADRLHYRPNLTARNLSTGRTMTISLVLPDLGNPMFQGILRSLTRAAESQGYSVLVAEAISPQKEASIARDARRQCDAVVLVSPRMDDIELDELVEQISPVVVLNRRSPLSRFATVNIDYASGMSQLVEHLRGLGHHDLLYVAGPPRSAAHRARLGALNSMADEDPSLTVRSVRGGSTMTDGYAVAEQVLRSGSTAAVAFNDLVAFGILARLNEFGVHVPGDISVTGFDGIELTRYAIPALTTVDQEGLETGAVAWALLRRQLDGADGADTFDHEILQPRLVVGDSTGRVPPSRVPVVGAAPTEAGQPSEALMQKPLGWVQEGQDWTLLHGGTLLGAAVTGATMPPIHSPRPHLHPVRSLDGRAMTITMPVDHRHHFGASLALPDVNGTTYWGGRTFVEGRGSTLLSNHGVQEVLGSNTASTGHELRSQVRWLAHDKRELLLEQRSQSAFLLPEHHGWGLTWHSRLEAGTEPLRLTSPANKGRLGAGYGGLFWRLPSVDETRILVEEGHGESLAHGSSSTFIIIQRRHGSGWSSLVLIQDHRAQGRIDPWFVRSTDYVGIGTSLAWSRPRDLALGEVLTVQVHALILDHAAAAEEIPGLLAAIPAIDASPSSTDGGSDVPR